MKQLQILGTGCPRCAQMAEAVEAAAKALGLEYELVKVTEIEDMLAFGAMSFPALAVDGVLKIAGRVPNVEEIKKLILN